MAIRGIPVKKKTNKEKTDKKPLLITTFFVILFCVGFFGMVAYRSQMASAPQKTAKENLIDQIKAMEEENDSLEAKISALQRNISQLSLNKSFDTETTQDLEAVVKSLNAASGYSEITQGGIVVELNDNVADAQKERAENTVSFDAEKYIVHDKNILYLINEMRGFTPYICVNNQRIVANSTIRCVGSVIMVNQTRVAPPYQIRFGGDSTALMKELQSCNYYEELLNSSLIVNVSEENTIAFPAYTGTINKENITVIETEVQ